MNNPGQLLDSHDEPVEYIEKKWLVPLVLCLIAFGYIDNVLMHILPSGSDFERNIYASALLNAGSIIGGLLYILTGRKIITIYIGFILLLLFCIVAPVFLLKGMNIHWVDACLCTIGAGMVYYPLLSLFLKDSLPEGKKQVLYLVLLFSQGALFSIASIQNNIFIHPENTGVFPFLICGVLFLIALLFLFTQKPTFKETPVTFQNPKKFPIRVFFVYLLFSLVVSIHNISYIFHFGYIPGRHPEVKDYFNIGSLLLVFSIGLYLYSRNRGFTYSVLQKTGLPLLFVSILMSLVIVLTKHSYIFHDYFTMMVEVLTAIGGTFFNFGILLHLMQYHRHKYFSLILVIPVTIPTMVFVLLIALGPETIGPLLVNGYYFLTMVLMGMILFFYLYLNRKTKTISHEPPRHEP